MIDVNPYTLQHKRFENIFAFGDCVGFDTTRTQVAAQAQVPIIKHNVQQYLHGKDLNAIYDGFSFMPLILGMSYSTSFRHLHNFEPHPKNHFIPHYGVFSKFYFGRMLASSKSAAVKFSDFKKNHGPPHFRYSARYDPLENNEYLQSKNIDLSEVRMFEPKVLFEDHHHDHH